MTVGGVCPDHGDAIYASAIPSNISKSTLISSGRWMTNRAVREEEEQAAAAVRHHFS
jgi:hypothetical protein